MHSKTLLTGAALIFVLLAVALLATLTQEEGDPCDRPAQDIAGAVLADQPGDQDALTNRAMLEKARCEKRAASEKAGAEPESGPESESESESESVTDDQSGIESATIAPEAPAAAAHAGQAADSKTAIAQIGSVSLVAATPVEAATAPVIPRIAPETPTQVLEQRCMVCHGCYDAPCQLKLEAHEGLVRGASNELVYNGARLRQANLSRLFDDALTERQWRKKGFHPVLSKDEPAQGVMYRMLQLKQAHPLPEAGPLPDGFDFSLYRDQQCTKEEDFDKFSRENPLWGMPYGFPGLNTQEHETLGDWLLAGAPAPEIAALSSSETTLLNTWESFLNGESDRERLVSRYIYEHLFLASLYLEENAQINWFRLVRSATPPGQEIELIATRRPYDDPDVKRVYYRLQRMPVTPLAKIHLPYRFDGNRLSRYTELFITPDYKVSELPDYAAQIASNPFKTFAEIPVAARYRFLLDDAQFAIMNFIKGPVCRGQVALNVIDDHFWVMFIDPELLDPSNGAEFLAREMDNLRLPNPATGTAIDILSWRSYAKSHERYLKARSEYINSQVTAEKTLDIESIWDGGGSNDNAALTIFRHFDTASVERGFIGENPKTAWVIDYSLLERIHYLLVAGFDVYGSVSHQLESRLYMDFLRMEGELNFLMFLPAQDRIALHDHWYRDARKRSRDQFLKNSALDARTSGIEFKTEEPKSEFLSIQRNRIQGAHALQWSIHRPGAGNKTVSALEAMMANTGKHNSYLPQTSFLNVIGDGRDEVYTLLLDAAHSNIAQMFQEDKRRIPEEDKLTIVHGFLGAYPNYFFQVNEGQIEEFALAVASLSSEEDFTKLRERFGVRRNVPWFWRLSDKLHAKARDQGPVAYGLFDYNRYRGD